MAEWWAKIIEQDAYRISEGFSIGFWVAVIVCSVLIFKWRRDGSAPEHTGTVLVGISLMCWVGTAALFCLIVYLIYGPAEIPFSINESMADAIASW